MAQPIEDETELRAWFGQEIERQLPNRQERDLYSLE